LRCRLPFGAVLDQPVANASHGFDREWLRSDLLREMAQSENAAVECVVADDAAFPALLDQLVPGHDRWTGLRKRNKDLHHPRLQLVTLVIGYYGKFCRSDPNISNVEIPLVGEIDARARRWMNKIVHDRQ
jgi:hypothetical protein